jgi:amidohydrolase
MKLLLNILALFFCAGLLHGQTGKVNDDILKSLDQTTKKYLPLYQDLHRHPELSFMEFETSEKMACELRELSFEVTTNIGGNGVVGVLRNGKGKVIMIRTDMDALPVKENTGLPFESKAIVKDVRGNESPAMHACGHDLHMSVWLGTLRTLVALRNEWSGTIVAIAQPAEEVSGGSNAMIKDGLFIRFPKPDFALAYHVSPDLPSGTIGYCAGPVFAGAASAEITVYGIGGHGAMPHKTIDPIVLSARIIIDLQNIVSRETNPVKPAVVSVGTIHGGTKNNIIPEEVKMLLSIRYFEDNVFEHTKEAIGRITRGAAIAAGLAEDKMPAVTYNQEFTPPVVNDKDLVLKATGYMKDILGNEKVIQVDPAMVAEDFGKYGRTQEKIPIAVFWLGGVSQSNYNDHLENGIILPSLHNSSFAPDFEPSFKCGVSAMSKAIMGILNEKQK